MSKGKTDYKMLKECGDKLESYARDNSFDIKRHSEYQWNISQPIGNMLLSVYPGSGLIYAVKLHYANTGLIDSTSKKYRFNDMRSMINNLNNIFFAQDSL